jgi:hypothetical protein
MHEVNYSPPYSTEVKNEWMLYLYSPHIPSDRNKFAFYVYMKETGRVAL